MAYPTAADFTDAARFASRLVEEILLTGGENLRTQLDQWIRAVPPTLSDPASIAQRTVYNLVPIGADIATSVPPAEAQQTQVHANTITFYLWKCARGIQGAFNEGRITAGQYASLLSAWNNAWS
jgi:hypothetical protein